MTRNKRKLQKALTKAELKWYKGEKKQRNRKNKFKKKLFFITCFFSFFSWNTTCNVRNR